MTAERVGGVHVSITVSVIPWSTIVEFCKEVSTIVAFVIEKLLSALACDIHSIDIHVIRFQCHIFLVISSDGPTMTRLGMESEDDVIFILISYALCQ